MCGARCLICRGEASKGARCQMGRDVWFPQIASQTATITNGLICTQRLAVYNLTVDV